MSDIDTVYGRFGALIRQRRKDLGLTQETVGEWVGVSRITINHIEQGRQRCAMHTALRIAKFLEFDIHNVDEDGPTIHDLLESERQRKIADLKAQIERLEADPK